MTKSFEIISQCGCCGKTLFLASRLDAKVAVRTAQEFENRWKYVQVNNPKGKQIYPVFRNGRTDNPFL